MTRRLRRWLAAPIPLAAAGVVLMAATASAHVTVDPSSAPKGAEITLGFRVPNEEPSASTVRVQVTFPSDHPILGVDPQAAPGWTDRIVTAALHPPVNTDDGPVTDYVSEIDWSGGSIPPGHFQEFSVLAQQLPTDTDSVTFKAVQTYSNGDVVRWIQTAQPGGVEPEHPAPVLTLTSGSGTPPASDTAGIVGIVLGALGTALGGTALVFATRRRSVPAGR